MTQADALRALIAKVEAGWPPDIDTPYMRPYISALGAGWKSGLAEKANRGSLDAAMSLHEALLPGEGWHVEWMAKYPTLAFKPAAFCASVGWGTRHAAYADTPARAWLLAILKAKLAEVEQNRTGT